VAQGLASEIPREPGAPPGGRPEPRPMVPEPGDILVGIRTDIVTGRRFRVVGSSAPGDDTGGPPGRPGG